MHFNEPDVREAYRQGARDCFESFVRSTVPSRQRSLIEAWLQRLNDWQDSEEPPPPPI